MRLTIRVAITLVALLGLPGLALAQHAGKGQAKDKDGAGDGVQVAVDPATGKLRQPTREEVETLLQGMQRQLDQSSEGLTVVRQPNGVMTIDLDDRFQSVSVARVGAGGVSTECVSTPGEARAFLERPAPEPVKKAVATPILEEK